MNERIVSDPKICGGEPCIKATRVPVHIILSHLHPILLQRRLSPYEILN